MKKTFFLLLLIFIRFISFCQQTFPENGTTNPVHTTFAFINARIIVDANTTIENGILLIKDGIITAVGAGISIPKGSVISDLKGKFIYPSLIDAYTSYGMPEIKKLPSPTGPQLQSNIKGAYGWNQAIKADVEATKLFATDSKSADEMRKMGFGTVLTFQKDGIVRGAAAAVSLADGKENNLILRDKAAAMYSFDKGTSTQDYPTSLMGAIALIRQTYLDADWYKKDKTKKEYNISLDAFNTLQSLPQLFETTDKLNVLRANKIAKEFNTTYIMKGSGNEYQRLDDMKASNCKFIIPLNFPVPYDVEDAYDASIVSLTEMKHWELAPANPFALEKLFIPFAITTSDLKDKKDFWKNLRKAISYGLSEKQALQSLTSTPAEMLAIADKVGSLKTGLIANFIITSGNLFDEKTVIYENWIQGSAYKISDYNAIDVRGLYDFSYGNNRQLVELKIEGELDKPKATFLIDTSKVLVNIVISGNNTTITFSQKDIAGTFRLSGNISAATKKMTGKGQTPTGDWIDWNANYKSTLPGSIKKDSIKKQITFGKVFYPFCAYGKPSDTDDGNFSPKSKENNNRYDSLLIKDVTVWTNEQEGVLKNKDVFITGGHITRIADEISITSSKIKIIDGKGKYLTSGIIDEHSHIALASVNEGSQSSSAEVRQGDVINSEDINIYRQLAGGVTTSQLLHGSANPIGGQSAIIKLRWGKSPEEMKFENADGFIKFALGENVKQSNWGDLNVVRFPQSRMGVEQVYYDFFTRAKEYDAKQKANTNASSKTKTIANPFRKDLELEAISEILNKKRFITCHSYVQSEINMLMHVGDSMGFQVNTFTHILEGYKVADKMKERGIGASTFSDWWAYKMEVKEAIPYNASLLNQMGIVTAINSDDAEMGRRLNQEAAKTVKYGGTSEEDAWKMVTLNPAKLLHLERKVGSIKVGKDADVVLWSDNPLSIYAKVEKTIIDGKIYFDIEEDAKLRIEIQKERARLIQKMIDEKKAGTPTQKPFLKKQKSFGCDTMDIDYLNTE